MNVFSNPTLSSSDSFPSISVSNSFFPLVIFLYWLSQQMEVMQKIG